MDEYIKIITTSLMLGFSTAGYCLITCGLGFASYIGIKQHKNLKTKIFLFFLARFLIYLFIGFLTGYFSVQISRFFFNLHRIIYIIIGIYLIILSDVKNKKCFADKNKSAFILGILTGIQPCPPFIALFTSSLLSGGIIYSIISFLFFYIASSLIILLSVIPVIFLKFDLIKKVSRFILSLTAVLFIYFGLLNIAKTETDSLNKLKLLTGVFKKNYSIQKENNIYKIYDEKNNLQGTLFFSDEIVPDKIIGYNGSVPVMVFINNNNIIETVKIIDNNETEFHLQLLEKNNFLGNFIGKNIDEKLSLKVDSYTGATITANAVYNGINLSLQKIRVGADSSSIRKYKKYSEYIYVSIGIILTLCSLLFKNRILRYITMFYAVIILGFLNKLYISINDLISIISGGFKVNYLSPFLILFLFSFAFLLFKGKIYCAYLCPFGNLSELLHRILKKINLSLYNTRINSLYFIKYLLLSVFIIYLLPHKFIFAVEPFLYIFSFSLTGIYGIIAIILILYSAIDFRFFCKYICLLNGLFDIIKKIQFLRKKN